MTLRLFVLALCLPALAACDAGVVDAAGALASAQGETFTPRVVTSEDIPPDIHEDSWARLPRITRESLDADGQRAYDVIVHPDSRYSGGLRGPIGMWMYSPPMAEHLFPASTYLRFGADGNRDQRLAELAILTAARALDSQYEWSAHEPLGLSAGLEAENHRSAPLGHAAGRSGGAAGARRAGTDHHPRRPRADPASPG